MRGCQPRAVVKGDREPRSDTKCAKGEQKKGEGFEGVQRLPKGVHFVISYLEWQMCSSGIPFEQFSVHKTHNTRKPFLGHKSAANVIMGTNLINETAGQRFWLASHPVPRTIS